MSKSKKKKGKSKSKSNNNNSNSNSNDNSNNKSKSKSKMKKLIMKGKAPVDEHFPFKDSFHVWEENGVVWDAMLNQTNISQNNNKFYKMQILELSIIKFVLYYL